MGVTSGELQAALQRVLSSEAFAGSQRQQGFLRHLVQCMQAGRTAELKESVLAIEIFGRPAARFDPKADSIVRVEARRLRQRLASYYAGPGAADALEITLPVGSYVPVVWARDAAHRHAGTRCARDLVERGDHFLREGDFHAALQRYQQALREANDYAPAYLGAARAWINLGTCGLEPPAPNVDHALEALHQTLALAPELPEALALHGLLLHRFEHDWARAEPVLQRAVALAPDDARSRALYGFQLIFAGLHDEAERQLNHARRLDPQNPAFRLHMAWLRQAQRRWDDAEKEYAALLDIAPDNVWALLSRADTLLYRGRCDQAERVYRDVRERLPGHGDCLAGLACALFRQGRPAQGQHALAEALACTPAPSHHARAEAQAAQGDDEGALALLREGASERDPMFLVGAISPLFEPLHGHPGFEALYRNARAARARPRPPVTLEPVPAHPACETALTAPR